MSHCIWPCVDPTVVLTTADTRPCTPALTPHSPALCFSGIIWTECCTLPGSLVPHSWTLVTWRRSSHDVSSIWTSLYFLILPCVSIPASITLLGFEFCLVLFFLPYFWIYGGGASSMLTILPYTHSCFIDFYIYHLYLKCYLHQLRMLWQAPEYKHSS